MNKIFDFKTFLTIIGLAIPIIFFVKTQKVKELSFKNIAITELVSEKDITDEAIKVYFDDVRVLNLYSISCILTNSGNIPITNEDLTNGIVIEFPDSIQILKYSIKKNPSSIIISKSTIEDSKFKITPDLLNQNENIEFSFYISSNSTNLLPLSNSRLIGGKIVNLNMNEQIKPKTEFKNRAFVKFEGFIFWCAFLYTILYLIIFIYAIYIQKDSGLETAIRKLFAFLFLSLGLFFTLFYLIQTRF